MKKTAAFLMALLLTAGCLFALAGCVKQYSPEVLSTYLDEEGFVAGMTQLGLQEIAKRYTGTDPVDGAYYDGESVVGWRASGENYSFENGYRASEDGKTSTRKNSFSTSKNLSGLTLPCGIRFSDTIERVLKRLSIEFDAEKDFDQYYDAPLWSEDDKKLYLIDMNGCVIPEDGIGQFRLQYTEIFTAVTSDGREERVIRSLGFYFDSKDADLRLFTMSVTEEFDVGQSE